MLPHLYRLPARTQLSNARFYKTPFFSVRIAPNNLPHSRFGFVIGKKVAKTAVDRNRSKRLVRACIEQELETIKTGYDFLFVMSKNLADEKQDVVYAQVVQVLVHSNLK